MRTRIYDSSGTPDTAIRVRANEGVDHERAGVRVVIPRTMAKADAIAHLRALIGEVRKSHKSGLEAAAEEARAALTRAGIGRGMPCPQCGSEMSRRELAMGPILTCSAFPKCSYSEPMPRDSNRSV